DVGRVNEHDPGAAQLPPQVVARSCVALELAARGYFGKPANGLTLEEGAASGRGDQGPELLQSRPARSRRASQRRYAFPSADSAWSSRQPWGRSNNGVGSRGLDNSGAMTDESGEYHNRLGFKSHGT